MMAPGAGAGNEAAADAVVKGIIQPLHKALAAYAVGSKKYAAVLNALRALTANFGREESTVPAALQQMAMANRGGGPMQGAPPPGIQPAPPPGGAGIPPVGPGAGGGGEEEG